MFILRPGIVTHTVPELQYTLLFSLLFSRYMCADHSEASVRKYEDVVLTRFPDVPSHMVVDPVHRDLYIADTGAQRILRIHPDSGSMSRSAMVEFPIYSSMSPRFAYELWTCTIYEVFVDAATGATAKAGVNGSVFRPSGLAVSASLLYVEESCVSIILHPVYTLYAPLLPYAPIYTYIPVIHVYTPYIHL